MVSPSKLARHFRAFSAYRSFSRSSEMYVIDPAHTPALQNSVELMSLATHSTDARSLNRTLKQCHLREDWRWMYISGPEKRCSSRSGRTCRRLRRATDLIPLTGIAAVFVGHSDTGRLPVLCRSILANRSSSRFLGANLLPSKGSLPLPLFLQLVPRRVLQAPLQRTFDPFLQVTCSERSTICLPKRIRPSSLDWSLSRWQGGSI